jgi:putative CRISPR-associated protein (TIGR02620 family)
MKRIEIIVSRHQGLVDYLREIGLADAETQIISHASAEVVRGKRVCGVLPHSLSCLCETFTEVPLNLPQELRGTELTVEQVRQFAGPPATYRVIGENSFPTDVVELVHTSSTNGRWGLVVVGPKGCDIHHPQEGRMESLGKIEGHHTFQFTPEVGSGQWFLVGGDLEPINGAGASVVCKVSLQSSNEATIIVGGEFFAVKSYGYKRRRSEIVCYLKGQKMLVPAAILASMGLIPCTVEAVNETAPKLESGLASALKAAGLV